MNDQKIINRILSGDEKGYETLFEKYWRKVFNYISQIVYNRLDTEDLTMVTFEKAFRNLHTWKPSGLFSTWLISIAKYTTFDWIKAQQIRVQGTDDGRL